MYIYLLICTEKQPKLCVLKKTIICYHLSHFFLFLIPVSTIEQVNSIFISTIQKWQFTCAETEQVEQLSLFPFDRKIIPEQNKCNPDSCNKNVTAFII